MVYVVGTVGFILGFIAGQMLLLRLLKDVPQKDLIEDKTIRWKYGILNWIVAGIASYGLVMAYRILYG